MTFLPSSFVNVFKTTYEKISVGSTSNSVVFKYFSDIAPGGFLYPSQQSIENYLHDFEAEKNSPSEIDIGK